MNGTAIRFPWRWISSLYSQHSSWCTAKQKQIAQSIPKKSKPISDIHWESNYKPLIMPNSLKATTLLGPSPVLAMPHIQKAASVEDTKEAVRDGTRMPPQQTQTARHCCTCLSTGMHETCNLLPFLDPFWSFLISPCGKVRKIILAGTKQL